MFSKIYILKIIIYNLFLFIYRIYITNIQKKLYQREEEKGGLKGKRRVRV